VVVVGLTTRLALAAALVPIDVVKPAFVYHTHCAPVPIVPPVWIKDTLVPLHIGVADALNDAGATDGVLTVTVTLPVAATFEAHGAPVVLSALK